MELDSITVSSTWDLTSVSMRYSQGDGVNISLSRLVYCTHVYSSVCLLYWWTSVPFLYKNGYLPWHGYVPPPSKTISLITWFGTISTELIELYY